MHIGPKIVFRFGDSSFYITNTVVFTVCLVIVMIVGALLLTRKMERIPGKAQTIAEAIVEGLYGLVEETMGKEGARRYGAYFGTLFTFLILANALGLFGFRPITADVNTTFALSSITFVLIAYTAIRTYGYWGHWKEMCEPYPFMLPLKLVEKVSLPISLAFRLFGNILGGMIVMELIFEALGSASEALHLPVPLLQAVIPLIPNAFFDMFEPVLQAYIFTMLSMVFVAMELPQEEGH